MRIGRWFVGATASVLFLLVACGGSKTSPTAPTSNSSVNTTTTPSPTPTPSATIAFHNSPIDTSAIEFIAPLGNLSPPGHNVPTNHIYLYNRLNNPSASASVVVAPAAGTVSQITSHGSDAKLEVQATGWRYYLDHIVLDASTVQGETLSAGQRVGMTGTAAYAIDFGLVNPSITLAFADPARYYDEFINADDPLKFFDEPLKTAMYVVCVHPGSDLVRCPSHEHAATIAIALADREHRPRMAHSCCCEPVSSTRTDNTTVCHEHRSVLVSNAPPRPCGTTLDQRGGSTAGTW